MFLRIESLDGKRAITVNTKMIRAIHESTGKVIGETHEGFPMTIDFVGGGCAEFKRYEFDVDAILRKICSELGVVPLRTT